jgi:Fe-S-cluster-containing hydrogenase component 2
MVDAAYLPRMCNHCDDAPCMKVGTDGSVTKRADGIVLIDPVKAKGRRDLVDACPFGAIVWNEAQHLPQSWFFDAHLLDAGWSAPRCVSVCPTQAIGAVRIPDTAMAQRAQAEGLRTLQPELQTRSRVYYRNLHRIDHCFIGGSATVEVKGVTECAEDCLVELRRGERVLAQTRSDAFGDFRFDGIEKNSGTYEVRLQHDVFGRAVRTLELSGSSVVLGEVLLMV